MVPFEIKLNVEIGLTDQFHTILQQFLQGSMQVRLDADEPVQEKAPVEKPVKEEKVFDFPLEDIPTEEKQLKKLDAAVESNPALGTLLKEMDCELVEDNSSMIIRQAIKNCRKRICGEGFTSKSPHYKELTAEFRRIANLLGSDRPSELPLDKVESFVIALSNLIVEDDKVTTELPF